MPRVTPLEGVPTYANAYVPERPAVLIPGKLCKDVHVDSNNIIFLSKDDMYEQVMKIKIIEIIWLNNIIEKINKKHKVSKTEVEDVFKNKPKFRRGTKGNYIKDNVYYAFGRTYGRRLMFIVFIFKRNNEALIISARDMDNKEKSMYSKL